MIRIRRLDEQGNELAENPVEISSGVADAGKIPALGLNGQLDLSIVPVVAPYVHDQAVPSAVWTISHGLNRFPGVTVVDTAGTRWGCEVRYDSPNQLTVLHDAPFAGKAYLH